MRHALVYPPPCGSGRAAKRRVEADGGAIGSARWLKTSISLGWRFEQGWRRWEGLSLAVGVVIVHCLQSLGVQGLALKWPNDIWLEGRKLAGVLIEVGGDPSGQFHLVLGGGLTATCRRRRPNIGVGESFGAVLL